VPALCALLLILALFPAFAQTPGDPTATPQYPDLPFEEVTEEPVGPVVQSEGMAVEHRADISQSCLLAIKNLSLSCEPVDPSAPGTTSARILENESTITSVGQDVQNDDVAITGPSDTTDVPVGAIPVVTPSGAANFTYNQYSKASESWKRGFVSGISQYMSIVAQPDEEAPYPVRNAYQRCLSRSPDILLVRHVEGYVAKTPASLRQPMVVVVIRTLFDLCRSEIENVQQPQAARTRR
jgi:hypothetical protein